MWISTDAKTNLYLSYGRLSIDAEYIGLGSRTYKKHCAPVLSSFPFDKIDDLGTEYFGGMAISMWT
jgi:hypothetical protein